MPFLLSLLSNPKNLLIAVLSALLIVVGIGGFYYKQKSVMLESQVKSLTQENANLKSAIATLNQHNVALQTQIKNNENIVKDYNNVKNRINALRPAYADCLKVTVKGVVKQPGVVEKQPGPVEKQPEGFATPLIFPPQNDSKVSPVVEKEKEYVYGGDKYEQDAISTYNDIVNIFSK